MKDSGRSRKPFWIGAAIGGVAGAVCGLLLAPKAGKELRRDTANAFRQAGRKTREIGEKVQEAAEWSGRVKTAAAEAGEKVKMAAEEWGNQAQETAGQVRGFTAEWSGKLRQAAGRLADEVNLYREYRRSALALREEIANADPAGVSLGEASADRMAERGESATPATAKTEVSAESAAAAKSSLPLSNGLFGNGG